MRTSRWFWIAFVVLSLTATFFVVPLQLVRAQDISAVSGDQFAITCAATATLIKGPNAQRQGLAFTVNGGATTVYIGPNDTARGGAALTINNGTPIQVNGSMTVTQARGQWYCIVSSGTADLRVIELSK